MYFHNMGFIIDDDVIISDLKTGEEVYFKPNLSEKKIDVYCKDNKIGNLLNKDHSIIFEVPDVFCERLFKREKWVFNFKIKGIYNASNGKAIGKFNLNSLHEFTGITPMNSIALIDTQVEPSGKKYVHLGGFRQVYGEHGEKLKE